MTVITGICLVVSDRRRPLPAAAAGARRGQGRLLARGARLLPLRRRRLRLPPQLPRRRLPGRRRAASSGRSPAASGEPAGAHLKARAGASRRRAAHPARVRRGDGARRPGHAAGAGPDGADPDAVDVAGAARPIPGRLPPRRVLLVRLALRAFEWSPFPWRFSRARASRRARTSCARWTARRSWIRQDLLLLLKVLTGQRLRERPARPRRRSAPPRAAGRGRPGRPRPGAAPAQPLGDLEPGGDGEDCDVAIVGSGAGGAVAATRPRRGRTRRARARGRPVHGPPQLSGGAARRRSPRSTATAGSPSPRACRRSRPRSGAPSAAPR